MKKTLIVVATLCIVVFGTNVAKSTPLAKLDYKDVLSKPQDDKAFDAFVQKLPTVILGGDAKRTYYVMEGDLLLTRAQVRATLFGYLRDPHRQQFAVELKVLTDPSGRMVFWDRNHRSLTYAVDRSSFPHDDQYQTVVHNIALAAKNWEDACATCNISFVHEPQLDARPREGVATFIVRYNPEASGGIIAHSFFPNAPQSTHYLEVMPSYFTTTFDKVGVLRHEIGHILGYRHEHIGGIPGCSNEDGNWRALTPYDNTSVMHYFCGGGGSMTLALSRSDIAAHVKLYALR